MKNSSEWIKDVFPLRKCFGLNLSCRHLRQARPIAEVAAANEAPLASPAIVELSAPAVVGKQCLFELNSAAGATLRVQLLGYDTADVEALARAVWSAE